VRREYVGKKIVCNYCDRTFLPDLPADPSAAGNGASSAVPASTATGTRETTSQATSVDDKIQLVSRQLATEDTRAVQLQAANRDAARLREQLATLRGQLEQSAGELDEARAERDQARAELEALRQQTNAPAPDHEQRVSSLTAELDALREAHRQAETARAEAARTADQVRGRVANLEDALRQAAEGHAAALEAARGEWTTRLAGQAEEHERHLNEARSRLDAERGRREEEAAAALRRLEEERSTLRVQIDQLRAEAEALRDDRDRHAAHRDEAAVGRQEAEQRAEAATARLTAEIDRLGQACEAAAARERELVDRLEAAREKHRQALTGMAAERDTARAELEAERGRASEKQAGAAATERDLRARLHTLGQQLDSERAARRGEGDDLRSQLESLRQAHGQVAGERDLAHRHRREGEDRSRREIDRLTAALADATGRHESLAGEHKQATAAARALREQLAAVRREAAEKDKRLAAQNEAQARAAKERQTLQAALEAAQQRLDQERTLRRRESEALRAEAEARTAALDKQLASARADAERQRQELAALRRDLDTARADAAEEKARHKDWREQGDLVRKEHEKERAGLQAEVERLRQERDEALSRAGAVATERQASGAPVETASAAPERPWDAVGAAYEAALARDLGRGAAERPPAREQQDTGRRRPEPERSSPEILIEQGATGAEVMAPATGEQVRPGRSRFPIWACVPLAVFLWLASLPGGPPATILDGALGLLLAFTLLLQFRLWDDIEDADDEKPPRPGHGTAPAASQGARHVLLIAVMAGNGAYIAFSFSWFLVGVFLALVVAVLFWNRGLRRLCPGPVAASLVSLLKYPVLAYLVAAPAPGAPEAYFLLALVLVYLTFSVFELLHDERLRAAPGSAGLLALAMGLMVGVSALMAAALGDHGAPGRLVQTLLTGLGAAGLLLLFWRRRGGRAPGPWEYGVFAIALAWLLNLALAGQDFLAAWADLRRG
jgi:chromosome segregation ATPase